MTPELRLELLERVTAAFADEIDLHAPDAAVAWPQWPDVRSLIGHLGGIHGWAAEAVRAGERVADPVEQVAPDGSARAWYLGRRSALLDALRSVPVDAPCWTIAGPDRTAGFWRRRMVFETAKHLADLRASGGGTWRGVDELGVDGSADGVDELFDVFLARSRPELAPLPAPVELEATDGDRRWTVLPDWQVLPDRRMRIGTTGTDVATVRARTADLALFVWDRADPVADDGRFSVLGDPASVAALRDAPIHA